MSSLTLNIGKKSLVFAAAFTAVFALPHNGKTKDPVRLDIPASGVGASIGHSPSFSSFSFEPAFWYEFFGNATIPNDFTFGAISTLWAHGGQPHIRPGGITMDSMVFNASAGDPVRTTNAEGGVYRTTFGPAYYQSWDNFPEGTKFTSTLNFGNDSLDIARNMAVASVKYQAEKIDYFELGNEPNNYPSTRWNNSTAAYVRQWKKWVTAIDNAVNRAIGTSTANKLFGNSRWWASSSTTDETALEIRPVDLIPAGIDSKGQVAQYSIHSYYFATCTPERAAIATIPNILNHTFLEYYAQTEIMPSAQAALDAGSEWIIGEFNSIACSGNPNVSDTFANALWTVDSELIYAARNASACYLHQGATLVFQSSDQTNTAGDDGSPGYSTYSMLYPRDSSKRGPQRTLPTYVGLLFLAEAFATEGTQVRVLDLPTDIGDYFAAYAFYNDDSLSKLALLNMKPYYGNTTDDYSHSFHVGGKGTLKRMTAPAVDEKDSDQVTWAGQSFKTGQAEGEVETEQVHGKVTVRGSEAVLISFDK